MMKILLVDSWQKNLVKVYETWTVAGCMRRIRGQAEEVTRVYILFML